MCWTIFYCTSSIKHQFNSVFIIIGILKVLEEIELRMEYLTPFFGIDSR
jgi:hypothetical protein